MIKKFRILDKGVISLGQKWRQRFGLLEGVLERENDLHLQSRRHRNRSNVCQSVKIQNLVSVDNLDHYRHRNLM